MIDKDELWAWGLGGSTHTLVYAFVAGRLVAGGEAEE
jgi:hypothetical protein